MTRSTLQLEIADTMVACAHFFFIQFPIVPRIYNSQQIGQRYTALIAFVEPLIIRLE